MSTPDSDEFDPELDLIGRYERMLSIQIETINGIDDKAAHTTRLVGVLLGVVITGLNVLSEFDDLVVAVDTVPLLLTTLGGLLALLVSLVYAIITYLSSTFEYGPSRRFGEFMAQYDVSGREYRDLLLYGYHDALAANYRVVLVNSRRFQTSLAALLAALLLLPTATMLVILAVEVWLQYLVTAISVLVAAGLCYHVLRENYLTLPRQGGTNER